MTEKTTHSSADSSVTLSYAAFQQQGLELLKESQDYAVRVVELAIEHPLIRMARSTPATGELIDGMFGVATQAVELQRDFATRLASLAAK
ncbi:MAG: hypothetical protein ACXVZN_11000 [Gaiellaceae bacterium]